MTMSRDPALSEAFGRVLKASRMAAGLSQSRLADAVDIHSGYVYLLETDVNQATLGLFCAIAAGLKMKPEDLMIRVRHEALRASVVAKKLATSEAVG